MTDASDLAVSRVSFTSRSHDVPAILARPRDAAPGPGLIVLHEAFGLNAHIEDLVVRFAAAGYTTIAPDFYHEIGSPTTGDLSSVLSAMFALEDPLVVADVGAAVKYLRGVGATSVACIGFCAGGRQALLAACCDCGLDAAVDCWGGFLGRASADDVVTPSRPVPVSEMLGHVSCPVFLVGGAEDTNPSPSLLESAEAALRREGKTVDLKIYQDAGHAFLADYRPTYREAAAHLLWKDVLDFLEQQIGRGTWVRQTTAGSG